MKGQGKGARTGRGKGNRGSKSSKSPKGVAEDKGSASGNGDASCESDIIDSDEDPNYANEDATGKTTKRAAAKGKASKTKSKKEDDANEGEKKKKRSFPSSHLLQEWKKFLAGKRKELDGKMSYHKIMSMAAQECLNCKISLDLPFQL